MYIKILAFNDMTVISWQLGIMNTKSIIESSEVPNIYKTLTSLRSLWKRGKVPLDGWMIRLDSSAEAIFNEVLRPIPDLPINSKWYWRITADLIMAAVNNKTSSLIIVPSSWFSLPKKKMFYDIEEEECR